MSKNTWTCTKILETFTRHIVSRLENTLHKGQAGRIGVVGGSEEYTGAPYFAGITALKVGADLVHIFCEKHAATAIKSYSPELIVHPYMDLNGSTEHESIDSIVSIFPRLHAVVIGPGLSRNRTLLNVANSVITSARQHQLPMVIDADGLFCIQSSPELVQGYSLAMLTPNVNEFKRLCEVMNITNIPNNHEQTSAQSEQEWIQVVEQLARALGNVTIVRKGYIDIISNGIDTLTCSSQHNEEIKIGSPRRCGGQGDLLSGSAGVFLNWASKLDVKTKESLGIAPTVLAGWAACFFVKACSFAAFSKHGRSMTTGDMLNEVGPVFRDYLESKV